jgi:GH35 family endo-1,4-beta-xylanase
MLPERLSAEKYEDYLKRIVVHTRLLVRHYKDRIKFWQIENEPDWWEMHVVGGWRSGAIWVDPREFRPMLLHALNGAVHEEDPSARTIVNLEADAEKLDVREYANLCDMVGLDFYPNYKMAYPIDLGVFGKAQAAAKSIGSHVLIIETGYPSNPSIVGYSQERQAEYVKKACLEAYSMDSVNCVGIWRYVDTAWRSFPPQENHFGLFDDQGRQKLAWSTLIETIEGIKG